MNNAILRSTEHPPIPLAPLGLIDRLSLQLGAALIRRVESSRESRGRRAALRRERAVRLRERALLQAELERERSRWDSQLLFRNLG